MPLYKFLSLTATTGVGSSKQNKFVYGRGAKSGLGHQDLDLVYFIPNLSWWKGVIFLSAKSSWVLQRSNKMAFLVKNDAQNTIVTTRWIWKF